MIKINLWFGGGATARRRSARSAEVEYRAALQPPRTLSTVRDALRHGLGDPTLEVYLWLVDRHRYADGTGAPPAAAWDASRRRHDVQGVRGDRLATVLTDATRAPGAAVVDAVIRTAAIDFEHARRHTELLARLRDVESGHIRDAADLRARRGGFGFEPGDRVHRQLRELASIIGAARAAGDPAVRAVEALAETRLRHVLRDLCDLARIARPSMTHGAALGAAVDRLVAMLPLPVHVAVDAAALPPATASMVYAMVCEALANAVGHAGARRVTVTVGRHGPTVQIAVADDGNGGARPVIGGGILSLAACAAVRGGLVHVDSPPGSGTCFSAELPWDA